MKLPALTEGRLLRRYKRFLAEVELANGERITAHCPNTGAMTSCWEPGCRVQLSQHDNPRRKLAWTLERTDMGQGWIGVNTHGVNEVVAEAIAQGRVAPLRGYRQLRREYALELEGHPRSRLDLWLGDGTAADAYVEIKNATLLVGEQIQFPDAVTSRGLKHLNLLGALVAMGKRGVMIYAVNRPEGRSFAPAHRIDPAYAQRLGELAAQGLEVYALRVHHQPETMCLGEALALELHNPAG